MRSRIEGLTGLRFFAALGILFHHFGADLVGNAAAPLAFLQSLSSCVSFFFVLSGFILVHAYNAIEEPVRYRPFYVARIARVYPLYLLGMLVLAYPLARYGATYPDWKDWEILPVIGTNVLAIQAWIPRYANILNPPSWSLSAEAFFYLVFPFVANRFGRPLFTKPIASIVVLWAASVVAGLALEMSIAGSRDIMDMGTQFASFSPLVRVPEFLMGMALAGWYSRWKPRSASTPTLLWAASLVLLLGLLALGAHGIWRTAFHNGLLAPLFCLVILGFARAEDPVQRLLSSSPMVLLGEASYALYILHVPTMYVFHWAVQRMGIAASPAVLAIIYFALAIMASVVAHLAIERPGKRLVRGWLAPDAEVRANTRQKTVSEQEGR